MLVHVVKLFTTIVRSNTKLHVWFDYSTCKLNSRLRQKNPEEVITAVLRNAHFQGLLCIPI